MKGCNACHLDADVGPRLADRKGTTSRLHDGREVDFDADYVRRSIVSPKADVVMGFNPMMPSFEEALSEDEVEALVRFLLSGGPAAATD